MPSVEPSPSLSVGSLRLPLRSAASTGCCTADNRERVQPVWFLLPAPAHAKSPAATRASPSLTHLPSQYRIFFLPDMSVPNTEGKLPSCSCACCFSDPLVASEVLHEFSSGILDGISISSPGWTRVLTAAGQQMLSSALSFFYFSPLQTILIPQCKNK